MLTIGISHKTRYWQHYCFGHPPAGHRYLRMADVPWHIMGIRSEVLANTKFFLPIPGPDLYHTYNAVVVNPRPWVVEAESYMPRFQHMDMRHPVYRWAMRRLAGDRCKAMLFTSRCTFDLNREKLIAAGVDEAKMSVVYRAVERFGPQGRDPGHFTILFAGNGFYRKGGPELLKAFQLLGRKEARLVIISALETDWGVFPTSEEVAWAERTIAGHPHITLYRRLPHAMLIARMRAADVFVSTTFADPFNNTVLEAMGCSLPVITSNIGALPEVVVEGRNGWMLSVKDRPSEAIAEEIAMRLRQWMDDPGHRLRMGEESALIAKEKFDIGVRNAMLTQIYDRALA
jgi:glycosyltransferase involved in cell wall biosynthesis